MDILDKLREAKECFWVETDYQWHPISINEGIDKVKEGKYSVIFERFEKSFTDITERLVRLIDDDEGIPTLHVYVSPKDAPSIHNHQDPCYTIIYCLDGTKCMEVDGEVHMIEKGTHIVIEPNVMHRSHNKDYSISLSLGFENKC